MDLHLVTFFVAVVDHGGITKAAQSLYISQPSLSQAIRTLERRLGVTLFDRSGRKLELTDAGRALDIAARRILADVRQAKDKIDDVRQLRSGRVDIVTYSAFTIDPLVDLVEAFRARHPHLTVRIVTAEGPSGVLAALRRGDAEVGLLDSAAEAAALTVVPLGRQEMVLALPAGLATTDASTSVLRESVKSLPLIIDLSDRSTAVLLVDLIDTGGVNVVVDSAHPASTWDLVSRGAGATVLPRAVCEQHLTDVVLRSLDPPIEREYGFVLRPGEPSPAARAFLTVAHTYMGPPVRGGAALGSEPDQWN